MAMTDALTERIARGLQEVRERIRQGCERAGRDPAGVRLVAVSKVHPPEAVRAAYALGLRDFGENYVQELASKAAALQDLPDLRWRLIGHLQRNKARVVVRLGATIETVDSARLAETIARHAEEERRRVQVLVQVNVAGEARKSGCTPSELDAVVDAVRRFPSSLDLAGLMTVPPHTDDPKGARPFFRALRELAQRHGLRELSMGMTHDLEVAVEEGATLVRVGTGLFGPRPTSG
jgi:PLP dependent protein